MTKPLILDLCGGSGSWSRPYADSGQYDVRIIDLQESDSNDVRLLQFIDEPVHGILAAPPCTDLSSSGARWWEGKGKTALVTALAVADACIRAACVHRPKWWALENPVGRLRRYFGPPTHIFDPCDYGDPYTKRTLLWGNFILPEKRSVAPTLGSKLHKLPPSPERANLRSVTPAGFAQAFFKANP